jgi:glycosyltransferase involved in cell wall biosynthesis
VKKTPPQKKRTIFVVAGRLGKSLTVSKTVPFISHPAVERAFIFREERGFNLAGAEYVTLPPFIKKIKPKVLRKIVRFVAEPVQLIRYAIKIKPDLINGVFTLPKGLNAVIAGKVSRRKSVVSVIGGTVEITTRFPYQRFWTWFNLRMLKSADAVTTKGSRVTEYLIQHGIDKEKIFNLNGSIDIEAFYPAEKAERDIDILFVGTFRKLKGPDRVVKVIENLIAGGRDVKAFFLGNGALFKETEEYIQQNDLEKSIHLKGYVNNPAKYFQRSKVIIMPSTSEGLPTSMLEAMACGCVPVVSDVGNIMDAAHHEKNALVIPDWRDIEGFTKAATRLLDEPDFRENLAAEGRKTVVDNYSPEKQAEVVDRMLKYLF